MLFRSPWLAGPGLAGRRRFGAKGRRPRRRARACGGGFRREIARSALAFYIGKIDSDDPLVPIGKSTEIAP